VLGLLLAEACVGQGEIQLSLRKERFDGRIRFADKQPVLGVKLKLKQQQVIRPLLYDVLLI